MILAVIWSIIVTIAIYANMQDRKRAYQKRVTYKAQKPPKITQSQLNRERKRQEMIIQRPYMIEQRDALAYQLELLQDLQEEQERGGKSTEKEIKAAINTEKAIFTVRKKLMDIEYKLEMIDKWDSLP